MRNHMCVCARVCRPFLHGIKDSTITSSKYRPQFRDTRAGKRPVWSSPAHSARTVATWQACALDPAARCEMRLGVNGTKIHTAAEQGAVLARFEVGWQTQVATSPVATAPWRQVPREDLAGCISRFACDPLPPHKRRAAGRGGGWPKSENPFKWNEAAHVPSTLLYKWRGPETSPSFVKLEGAEAKPVKCGQHFALQCASCAPESAPPGTEYGWCNGECAWSTVDNVQGCRKKAAPAAAATAAAAATSASDVLPAQTAPPRPAGKGSLDSLQVLVARKGANICDNIVC